MSTSQILKDAKAGMEKALENSKKEFAGIRSGKASPNMLDTIKVEAYGSFLPLNQVASVSAPEPRILLVTPFDKGQAKAIEKAIRESDLGLDPAHQNGIIRVPLPSMTEQRRKELVKILHKLAEDGKIAIRHARTDARDKIKKLDGVSEDEKKSAEKELQKVHDDEIAKLEALLKTKEAEVMAV
ncbi:MAG: ribosome recycling factor [Gemmatimonadaceae bacterium]|jgi:ribosome recycling factor|uniref:ribosome recycling factor n=1 Tax=Gemmatimonas sp. TaxID=1962908 RepID=UPI001D463B53|nr:ribosome recycling factor [Gemmatimonas sp.]NCW45559.1 ribosome recycling factor [Gemmatimonadaceae bacterium]